MKETLIIMAIVEAMRLVRALVPRVRKGKLLIDPRLDYNQKKYIVDLIKEKVDGTTTNVVDCGECDCGGSDSGGRDRCHPE